MDSREQITTLPVPALLERCSRLVRRDRECLARLLEVLGEIDRRKVWAEKAYPSMFEFCRCSFNMWGSTAAKRIWAARVVRKYPVALPMVRRGELHLTAIHRLARHLTPENHQAVLDRARNKSTREIELLVAEIAPKPDVPARVRKLPAVRIAKRSCVDIQTTSEARRTCTAEISAPLASRTADLVAKAGIANASPTDVIANSTSRPAGFPYRQDNVRHDTVTPLAPARFRLQATIDDQTRDQLRQLQDLRSHGDGTNRDLTSILTDAIELLLTETLRKKAAVPARSTTRSGRRTKRHRTTTSPVEPAGAEDQQRFDLAPTASWKSRSDPATAALNSAAGSSRKTRNGETRIGETRKEMTPVSSRSSRTPSSRAIPEDESRRSSANFTRRPRAIPAAVRREVWLRDTGRCTFRADCGRRCAATAQLEFHHEVAFARVGKHEPGNISLRCRAHNQYQADLDFGAAFMDRKRALHAE